MRFHGAGVWQVFACLLPLAYPSPRPCSPRTCANCFLRSVALCFSLSRCDVMTSSGFLLNVHRTLVKSLPICEPGKSWAFGSTCDYGFMRYTLIISVCNCPALTHTPYTQQGTIRAAVKNCKTNDTKRGYRRTPIGLSV